MRLANDGLTIWYATPDAPAPGDDGVVPRTGASITVGAHPASPINSVQVRFRVDGGRIQEVPAGQTRVDPERDYAYFVARLPPCPTGDLVEYGAVLCCGGRQVPAPAQADRLPARFRLASPAKTDPPPKPPRGRFETRAGCEPSCTWVARVTVEFEPPQVIGETGTGMRLNYFVRAGTLVGNGISGRVLPGSSDHLLVRPDGIGVVRVRGGAAMDDGATLDFEYEGYADFGPDGYRMAMANALRDKSPLVLAPVISTRHPKYAWLSRVQCLGLGQTHLDARSAWYDLFVVAPRAKRPAG